MVSFPAAYRVFRGFIAMVAMLWPLAIAPSLRGEEPPSYRWIKVTDQAPFAARDGGGPRLPRPDVAAGGLESRRPGPLSPDLQQ